MPNEQIIATVQSRITSQDLLWTPETLNRAAGCEVGAETIQAMVDRGILKPVYFCEGYDGLLEVDEIDWDRGKFVHPEAGEEMPVDLLFTNWKPRQAESEAVMSEKIEITRNNDRGLQDYGSPVECLYGSKVTIRDSSSAEHVACWLNVDDRSWFNDHKNLGSSMSAHIDVVRAKAIVARLQAWIDSAESGDTPFGGLADQP